MIVKVNNKEFNFDGYVNPINSVQKLAEECYRQGKADVIDEFADALINPKNYERYDFDDCLSDSNKANDFFSYVFAIAEELKEQK